MSILLAILSAAWADPGLPPVTELLGVPCFAGAEQVRAKHGEPKLVAESGAMVYGRKRGGYWFDSAFYGDGVTWQASLLQVGPKGLALLPREGLLQPADRAGLVALLGAATREEELSEGRKKLEYENADGSDAWYVLDPDGRIIGVSIQCPTSLMP